MWKLSIVPALIVVGLLFGAPAPAHAQNAALVTVQGHCLIPDSSRTR